MGTSRSKPILFGYGGRTHGDTWPTTWVRFLGPEAAEGLDDYATYKGYSFDVNHDGYLFSPSWDTFVKEVQFGRPVVLNVDSSGGGTMDHSVTAIGYRTSNGYNEYGFRSTWPWDGTEVQWARWRDMSSSYEWGVDTMERVRPDGTWDTAWDVASGYWHNSSSWEDGVPNTNAFTYVPNGHIAAVITAEAVRMLNNQGTVHVQGVLTAGDIRNSGGYIALAGGSSRLESSRSIVNEGAISISGGTMQTENLYVAYTSSGSVTQTGGFVSTGTSYVGHMSGSQGTATVTGSGSEWTNGNLYVGYYGTGTLSIEAGGQVSGGGCLGCQSGSQGMARVTGSGSKWTTSGLDVGLRGTGTLNIEAGGQVSGGGCLGYESGSQGTATVTGSGSKWTNSSSWPWFYVGYGGTGTLRIEAGGQVSNYTSILAWVSGSQGTAAVTGTGSKWTNSVDLCVGLGGAGTLSIEGGGQVSSGHGYLGLFPGSQGTATVTGSGSKWNSGSGYGLVVGFNGAGTLRIEAGGEVSNYDGFLGDSLGSQGTATVTGSGSKWTNSGYLYVGREGTGALGIQAGGAVSNSWGCLGSSSGSQGTATVTGIGSKWTNSANLYVGGSGTGTLSIEAGGQVSSYGGYLGADSGSQGTATVTGSGSKWNSSALYVGHEGTGTLRIEAGGEVWIGSTLTVGSMGTVTLDGGTLNAVTIADVSGGSTTFSAGTLRFGTYQGSLDNLGCTVCSQDAAYGMAVTGEYSQGAAGTLQVELYPDAHDLLDVAGLATLGGTLEVVSSFRPYQGQAFDVILAGGGFDGGFEQVASNIVLGLAGPAFDVATEGTTCRLTFAGYTFGDANGSGAVDVGDLGILAGNWGGTGRTWAQADFTGEGDVNIGDLGVLAGNWGWVRAPGGAGTVPEPASLILLAVGGLAMIHRRRK